MNFVDSFCCETTVIEMAFKSVSFFAFKSFGVVLLFQFQDDQIVPVISDLPASLLLVQLATNQLTDVSLIIKNDKATQGSHEKLKKEDQTQL